MHASSLAREASVATENMSCMATPGQAHKLYATYMASMIDIATLFCCFCNATLHKDSDTL